MGDGGAAGHLQEGQQNAQAGYQQAISTMSDTQKQALQTLSDQQIQALGLTREGITKAIGTQQPYEQAGQQALQQYQQMLSGGFDVTSSPAFQAQRKSLNDALAAQGKTMSSSTQVQNLAPLVSAEYTNQFNRLTPLMNMGYGAAGNMANIYGQGYGQLSNLTSIYGTNLSNLQSNYGTNLANLQLGKGQSAQEYQQNLGNLRAQETGSWAKLGSQALGAGISFLSGKPPNMTTSGGYESSNFMG